MIDPLKEANPSFTAVILSKSRWLVGSSNSKTLALDSIILLNIQRTFHHQRALAFFLTSSPLNNIRPKKPRKKVSVCSSSGAY